MASDIGLGDNLKVDDFGRVYSPKAITQERFIRDMQREQIIASLRNQQSPAANTATAQIATMWPPKPE